MPLPQQPKDSQSAKYVNTCERDCLVHRLYALPLINDFVAILTMLYAASKSSSATMSKALAPVENTVNTVVTLASPYYDKYMKGFVRILQRPFVWALDWAEQRCSAISTTSMKSLLSRAGRA